MIRIIKGMAALAVGLLVASCGGGGGDAGSAPFGGGTGGSGATVTYEIDLDVQRSGVSTNQISSSETVQAVAVVRNASGSAIEGVVVTFAESGPGLLKFAPTVGTALTDSTGTARVDLSALSATLTGATTVTASAEVSTSAVTSSKTLEVTASGGGGVVATPAAVNFIGSSPSGVAIVVKGAGGSGRSESAILTFKVVDAQNAPINGVNVTFAINTNSGGATIQPTSATTNADGIVTTTVNSGTQPASIVVTASTIGAGGLTITTQSDTLIVSNSVPVFGGFEIVAEKYNLDGRFTGDSTTVTAFVRDEFGNPVPDGVAVNFTTDYGVVATSTLGGCTTVNGRCEVEFAVQNPRGNGLATVIAQIRVGDTTTLVDSIQVNMAAAASGGYYAVDGMGSPVTLLNMGATCTKSFELYLSDGSDRSTAAGTVIAMQSADTGVAVAVTSGSPVLDQLSAGFPPTLFSISVDLSATTLAPDCNAAGASTATAAFRLSYTTPHGIQFSQRIDVTYPQ